MAKDPKKLNPEDPYSKTYPGQDLNTGVAPTATDLLPTIFRTETNVNPRRFFIVSKLPN